MVGRNYGPFGTRPTWATPPEADWHTQFSHIPGWELGLVGVQPSGAISVNLRFRRDSLGQVQDQ